MPSPPTTLLQWALQAMFATKINTVTMLMLMAYSSIQAGQPSVPPTPPDGREARVPDKQAANKDAKKQDEKIDADKFVAKILPEGISHDFGALQRGTQASHAFRVVNPFNVPLKIAQVRLS